MVLYNAVTVSFKKVFILNNQLTDKGRRRRGDICKLAAYS